MRNQIYVKIKIVSNTMTKLSCDEEVSLRILNLMCKTLNADFCDIVEYVADVKIYGLYDGNRESLGKNHVDR